MSEEDEEHGDAAKAVHLVEADGFGGGREGRGAVIARIRCEFQVVGRVG